MTFNVGRVEGGTGAGAIAEIEHYLELVAAFQAAYPE